MAYIGLYKQIKQKNRLPRFSKTTTNYAEIYALLKTKMGNAIINSKTVLREVETTQSDKPWYMYLLVEDLLKENKNSNRQHLSLPIFSNILFSDLNSHIFLPLYAGLLWSR
jgi:hypothetical protein